jgi:hypothetical protein
MEKLKKILNQIFEENEDEITVESEVLERVPGTTHIEWLHVFSFLVDIGVYLFFYLPLFTSLPIRFFARHPVAEGLYLEHLFIFVTGLYLLIILTTISPLRKAIYIAIAVFILIGIYNCKRNNLDDNARRNFVDYYFKTIKPLTDAPIFLEFIGNHASGSSDLRSIGKIISKEISPDVRNYAVKAASANWTDRCLYDRYGDVIRFLSIYKFVNERYTYVGDPRYDEFFATPEMTIQNNISGDCDDYSILIFSLISAVSGECRLIISPGHIYPEVNLGDEFFFNEEIKPLVDSLFGLDQHLQLYYRIDSDSNLWLNFDYGDYPGRQYPSSRVYDILY